MSFLQILKGSSVFNWPTEVQMDEKVNFRYAEDYNAGDVFELGTYDVTREEIIEFSQNTILSHFTSTKRWPNKPSLQVSFRVVG